MAKTEKTQEAGKMKEAQETNETNENHDIRDSQDSQDSQKTHQMKEAEEALEIQETHETQGTSETKAQEKQETFSKNGYSVPLKFERFFDFSFALLERIPGVTLGDPVLPEREPELCIPKEVVTLQKPKCKCAIQGQSGPFHEAKWSKSIIEDATRIARKKNPVGVKIVNPEYASTRLLPYLAGYLYLPGTGGLQDLICHDTETGLCIGAIRYLQTTAVGRQTWSRAISKPTLFEVFVNAPSNLTRDERNFVKGGKIAWVDSEMGQAKIVYRCSLNLLSAIYRIFKLRPDCFSGMTEDESKVLCGYPSEDWNRGIWLLFWSFSARIKVEGTKRRKGTLSVRPIFLDDNEDLEGSTGVHEGEEAEHGFGSKTPLSTASTTTTRTNTLGEKDQAREQSIKALKTNTSTLAGVKRRRSSSI